MSTEYFEEDVSRKKRSIKAVAESGAPSKARGSNFHQPSTSWQFLPDLVFGDVMMMVGLHDLHKCRQICQSWNVMTTQMTKHEKDTIRKQAVSLVLRIRNKCISLPPDITTAASLAHHGILDCL